MITWGMVGNSHDASMACFIDDKPVWACMAKDFDHAKMKDSHPDFHWTMIEVANQSYGRPIRLSGMKSLFGKQQDNGGQDKVGCLKKIISRNI